MKSQAYFTLCELDEERIFLAHRIKRIVVVKLTRIQIAATPAWRGSANWLRLKAKPLCGCALHSTQLLKTPGILYITTEGGLQVGMALGQLEVRRLRRSPIATTAIADVPRTDTTQLAIWRGCFHAKSSASTAGRTATAFSTISMDTLIGLQLSIRGWQGCAKTLEGTFQRLLELR